MATYDINNLPERLEINDIVICPYAASERTITLPRGKYKLECWGGKGGTAIDSYTKEGGNGGYSYGEYSTQSKIKLYLNTGGRGQEVKTSTSTFTQAYNGGGKGNRIYILLVNGCSGGGGGATHIALRSGVLSNLSSYKNDVILVAGGGGGGYDRGILAYRDGGAGGGLSGGIGSGGQSGSAGTQTTAGPNAGFGYGADNDGDTYRGGAGGGGWYGGGAGYSNDAGGSGGSGYIADAEHTIGTAYLTNAGTTIQTSSTNPDSDQNGYIRITILEIHYVNLPVNIGGSWKNTDQAYVNIGGTWKKVHSVYVNINGTWKEHSG